MIGIFLFFHLFSSITVASTENAAKSITSSPVAYGYAQSMIEQALKVLSVVNKDGVGNPIFNKHQFQDISEIGQPAALLDYTADPDSLSRRNVPKDDDNPSEASSLNRLSYPGGARNSGSAYGRVRSAEAQGKLEPRSRGHSEKVRPRKPQ